MSDATIDHPPFAKPKTAASGSKPVLVSASAMATHLDCTRAYVRKLEGEGVIQRQGNGFPLDASRVAYLRFLRRERRELPRGKADADFQRAKTALLEFRLMEKRRELVRQSDVDALLDTVAGITLTAMSGMAARIAGHDLQLRRKIEQVVYETRVAIAQAASKMADAAGEPAAP